MIFLLIVFVLLLILNAMIVAADISLSAFGDSKLDDLKSKGEKSVKKFEKLFEKQEDVHGAIQILSTSITIVVSIIGFTLFNLLLSDLVIIDLQIFPETLSLLLTVILLTVIILIFNVLIPKALAFKYSDSIAKNSVGMILTISEILKYPSRLITFIANLFLLPFREKTYFSQLRPSEDEILDIISEGVKSGTLDEKEQQIIENIFEFNDLKANEVMIPRTEMIAIDLLEDEKNNINEIIKAGHTLVPAYEDSPDNIVGVLHTKDVIKIVLEKSDVSLKSIIRPAQFVPETKLISEILRDMQNQGERLAIVTDEYGGTEGVITMEDILEEIIGKIKDSSKVENHPFSKLEDGKYYILGAMNIDEFNEAFNMELPESDEYNTVAGFIAEKTGKILNPGENFVFEDLSFELIKKIRQKMVQFRVYAVKGDFKEKSVDN